MNWSSVTARNGPPSQRAEKRSRARAPPSWAMMESTCWINVDRWSASVAGGSYHSRKRSSTMAMVWTSWARSASGGWVLAVTSRSAM